MSDEKLLEEQKAIINFLRKCADEIESCGLENSPSVSWERPVERDLEVEKIVRDKWARFKAGKKITIKLSYTLL